MTTANTAQTDCLDEGRHTVPVYAQLPLRPVAGDGVYLLTDDGRRILDMYGGHAVACLGYSHPGLTAAISQQTERLLFQSNVVPMDVRSRAASALANFAPPGLGRVFFVNSGAEANENALRIACRRSGRSRVIALEGAFHGRSSACAAVTWGAAEGWYGFPRLPFDVSFVPRDDPAALAAAIGGDVAALIVEPIQGVAGAVDISHDYLRAARQLTAEHGSLLIFDEVQCGIGRSGYPFVADAVGVTPDLLTTAKGLAGGLPAGAVIMGDEIADDLGIGELGTTFGGGPVACAAIEAVIRAIREQHLLENVRRLSARLMKECLTGPVTNVQGGGFLLGLRTTRPAAQIRDALLERDILTGTSGDPHVLRLLPPLVLEDAHVDLLVQNLMEIRP
ncbi:MAG: aminotransferase class III-fold pyridoxal phosphate-dependent enzyme [Gammaproteobacteria bacterium]